MGTHHHDYNFLDVLSNRSGLGAIENRAQGCIGKAECNSPIKKPLDCAGLAPWIVCSFVSCRPIKGGQIAATVGSFDPAAKKEGLIKSYSMGFSDGTGCKLEIRDRKGSDLSYFFEKLSKSPADGEDKYQMRVKFGWSCSHCGGPLQSMPVSTCHYFVPKTMQINYSKGGFNYIIEGDDLMQTVFQLQMDKTYPEGGGAGMKLKHAVIQAWKDTPAGSIKCTFKRRVPGSKDMVDIAEPFVNGSMQPVVSTSSGWQCKGTNPMSAVAEWKKDWKTDKGYGLRPVWVNGSNKLEIMYIESGCTSRNFDRCEQTYIVNGGKHSPVISFNPTINWSYYATAESYGGGAGSTDTGASMKRKAAMVDNDCIVVEAVENVGERTSLPPTDHVVENEGPENAQQASDEGMNAQSSANNFFEPMTAELIVQGDPEMDQTLHWIDKRISIVVINPFHPVVKLEGKRGQIKNSEWLASPTCNPILTSKKWMINEVSHNMKEGSYTTTIKVTRDPSKDGD